MSFSCFLYFISLNLSQNIRNLIKILLHPTHILCLNSSRRHTFDTKLPNPYLREKIFLKFPLGFLLHCLLLCTINLRAILCILILRPYVGANFFFAFSTYCTVIRICRAPACNLSTIYTNYICLFVLSYASFIKLKLEKFKCICVYEFRFLLVRLILSKIICGVFIFSTHIFCFTNLAIRNYTHRISHLT